jgi:hypothetical protein
MDPLLLSHSEVRMQISAYLLTVMKTYGRDLSGKKPIWFEYVCAEGNHHVVVGKDNYFISGDGFLMPTRTALNRNAWRDLDDGHSRACASSAKVSKGECVGARMFFTSTGDRLGRRSRSVTQMTQMTHHSENLRHLRHCVIARSGRL